MAELLQKLSEKEKKIMDLLKRMEYIVERIDGDYAYLKNVDEPEEEAKCVARALLPENVGENDRLVYEMMEYTRL